MTHPDIIVSQAAHGVSEEVAAAFVEKGAYEALWIEREQWKAAAERALAENTILKRSLEAIDRHVVGTCDDNEYGMEPCEECGEMREIASQALAALKARSP